MKWCAFLKSKQKKSSENKYKNQKVSGTYGEFDSIHEEGIYLQLLYLVKAGKASNLQRQVEFEIIPAMYIDQDGVYHPLPNGEKKGKGWSCVMKGTKYIADFTYIDMDTKRTVVVDAKSDITKKDKVYVLKKKLMLQKYGILIHEM